MLVNSMQQHPFIPEVADGDVGYDGSVLGDDGRARQLLGGQHGKGRQGRHVGVHGDDRLLAPDEAQRLQRCPGQRPERVQAPRQEFNHVHLADDVGDVAVWAKQRDAVHNGAAAALGRAEEEVPDAAGERERPGLGRVQQITILDAWQKEGCNADLNSYWASVMEGLVPDWKKSLITARAGTLPPHPSPHALGMVTSRREVNRGPSFSMMPMRRSILAGMVLPPC